MSVARPLSLRTWVLTSSPWWKICTIVTVARMATCCPISFHGTE